MSEYGHKETGPKREAPEGKAVNKEEKKEEKRGVKGKRRKQTGK